MLRRTTHREAEGPPADEDGAYAPPKLSTGRRRRRRLSIPVCLAVTVFLLVGLALTVVWLPARPTSTTTDAHIVPNGDQSSSLPSTTTPMPAVTTSTSTEATSISSKKTSGHLAGRRPPLFVSSSTDLRRVCHEQAPELESTAWYRQFLTQDGDVTLTDMLPKKHAYLFMPYPVCIHLESGTVFAEKAAKRINRVLGSGFPFPQYLKHRQFSDLEELFAYMGDSEKVSDSAVQLIPALGMMPFGMFMATHMWHLIHDVLSPLAATIQAHTEEFWDVPRQAVLLDEMNERWLDRNGDLPLKQRLSAMILNGFSTFAANASNTTNAGSSVPVPAFANVPLVAHAHVRRTNVFNGAFPHLVPHTVCFCQNMFVPPYGLMGGPPAAAAVVVIQDRTALSFGAPPYRSLETESVWDIERQRTEHYPPWAQQFWQPTSTTSTTSTTVYQPRVLFIHRAKRTIANVGVYVKAMRDLGFRVEEAYLERLPTEQQYYLGRYADVVVGMHGLGIGHALWMNRLPTGCRTVIEFRPWAKKDVPLLLQRVLGDEVRFNYTALWPVDVVFGPSVADPVVERQRIVDYGHNAFELPGWNDQEAFFDDEEVMQTLRNVQTHLQECLQTTPASPAASRSHML